MVTPEWVDVLGRITIFALGFLAGAVSATLALAEWVSHEWRSE